MALVLALATVSSTFGIPAIAAAQGDPSVRPELSIDRLLPQILRELRRTLSDAGSMKDLIMCPASAVKLKDGHLWKWRVYLSFNTRTTQGGYAGEMMYAALFDKGGEKLSISKIQMDTNEGLDGVINRAIAKEFRDCGSVADDKFQEAFTKSRGR